MCAVIPVLDLMIGQVVLAQGGQRDQYRPVHSRLTHSSRPLDVAQAMFNQTGCDWLYVADIDSFAGGQPNWAIYRELLQRGFGLWIDANWLHDRRYQEIADELGDTPRLKVIISSETLSSEAEFEVLEELQQSGLPTIFSLDRKGHSVITSPGQLHQRPPLELVQLAYQHGAREMIVLDLDSVGTGCGVSEDSAATCMIGEIAAELPDVRLISGGGVRNAEDVRAWLDLGCHHVLVASAIHDGNLTPDDVTQLTLAVPRA